MEPPLLWLGLFTASSFYEDRIEKLLSHLNFFFLISCMKCICLKLVLFLLLREKCGTGRLGLSAPI